jgi:hypothetical protein
MTYRGFKFYLSNNNVWLTDHVPQEDVIIGMNKEAAQQMVERHERLVKEKEAIQAKHNKLLQNIKDNMPELEELLERVSSHWGYEDPIYRFYYHSFKVYHLQADTQEIVNCLRKLTPHDTQELDKFFEEIYQEGAAQNILWSPEHNKEWTRHTRSFVEAFFHAKFFLEMVIKYGKELDEAPYSLPSGWAAILCLYNLR